MVTGHLPQHCIMSGVRFEWVTNSLSYEDNCCLELFYALANDQNSKCEGSFTIFTGEQSSSP